MSEDEWLSSRAPAVMLGWLEKQLRTSRRKIRLFVCGCCGLLRNELRPGVHAILDAAEEAAEHASCPPRSPAHSRFYDALLALGQTELSDLDRKVTGLTAWALYAGGKPMECIGRLGDLGPVGRDARHAELLRELFGNPFRKIRRVGCRVHARLAARGGRRAGDILLVRDWLAWENGTAAQLARTIHDERAFDRMGILADALEEAGCDEPALLDHLRGPGPHTRGCWALDAVLDQD